MDGTATAAAYLRRILPRSLHLPVAVVGGSLTENLNRNWGAAVDRSFVKSGTFRIAVNLPANQLGPWWKRRAGSLKAG